jgi:hippurate hydrolase
MDKADAVGMRDPENELYERASDLVEAAAAMRDAIRPEAAAAVPALLGCLNAALADLRLEDFYRDIHQHPELSLQEHRTAALAAQRLQGAGYQVTAGVGGTGVVGLLANGDGPTVMLRAETRSR